MTSKFDLGHQIVTNDKFDAITQIFDVLHQIFDIRRQYFMFGVNFWYLQQKFCIQKWTFCFQMSIFDICSQKNLTSGIKYFWLLSNLYAWCQIFDVLCYTFDVYNQNFAFKIEYFDSKWQYLKSAVRKIWRLASNIYAWYQIFDAVREIFDWQHQNLMSQVKFWRHKCVPPLCHDLFSTKVILRTRKFIDGNGKDRCMFTDLQSVRNGLGFGGAVCRGFASDFVVLSLPGVGANSEMVSDGLVFVGDEIVSSPPGCHVPHPRKRRNYLPCCSSVAKVQGNSGVNVSLS